MEKDKKITITSRYGGYKLQIGKGTSNAEALLMIDSTLLMLTEETKTERDKKNETV
jgi:hypothetical protein